MKMCEKCIDAMDVEAALILADFTSFYKAQGWTLGEVAQSLTVALAMALVTQGAGRPDEQLQ